MRFPRTLIRTLAASFSPSTTTRRVSTVLRPAPKPTITRFAVLPNLTSSRRQTLSRYGGGFQVGRLVGSRFFAGDSSPNPRRNCPAPFVLFVLRRCDLGV